MSNPVSAPQPTTPVLRQARWPAADMRVGDAERAEIADRLARHFSDGRLDEAEFSDRLDRAMRAKTMAELSGLLSDLPGSEPVPPQPGGRRHQRKMLKVQLERERLQLRHEQRAHRQAERELRWRTLRWLPLLIAVLVGALIVAHTLTHSIGAWLVLGLIAFLWLRRNATAGHDTDSRPGDTDNRPGDSDSTHSY
jgi:hypothetical protein